MNIIYCLNSFLPQQVAGTEVYTLSLAKIMQERGNIVTIVIPNFGNSIDEIYYHENIKVIKFAETTLMSRKLISGEVIPNGVVSFEAIIKNIKPDIIHFHTVGGSNGISLHHVRVAKKNKLTIVITFHLAGYTCNTSNLLFENKEPCNGLIDPLKCTKCVYTNKGIIGFKKSILYNIAKVTYAVNYNTRNWNNTVGTALSYPFIINKMKTDLLEMVSLADKIVVLTNWYKKVLEINNLPKEKLQIISQGLAGYPLTNNRNEITDYIKIVFVGRINESKGLHLLLKAISEISSNIELDIYGPINDEDYAIKWKFFSANYSTIRWMGVIEPSHIVHTLSTYHILCLPSVICEMSPLVIQEAYAAGIPVLASNVYGNAEQIVDGHNGWLFNFDDSFDLKNKLQQLIADPSLIEKAKANILPVKSFDIVADEHEKMYSEILTAV